MRTIHGLICGAALLTTGVGAAENWYNPSLPGTSSVLLPLGSEPVLYDQSAPPGTSGMYNTTHDVELPTYSSEGADDFEVTGAGWEVTGFTFNIGFVWPSGALYTGPSSYHVWVYADQAGLPAATALCGGADLPGKRLDPSSNSGTTVVPLPVPCALPPGRYWVGLSVALIVPPSAMWGYAGSEAFLLHSAVWRNPGDGFGYGCTVWEPVLDCLRFNPGGGFPNFRFQVLGTPTALPELIFTNGFEP